MSKLFTEKRVVSVTILAMTAGLIVSTFGRSFANLGGAFSPMFFPRIILVTLLVLATLNLIIDLRAKSSPQSIELLPVFTIGLAFLVYVFLIMPLGYFISSVLLGGVILFTLGLRSLAQIVLIPVCAAGILVALFNHVLKMPLPTSPFTWWI